MIMLDVGTHAAMLSDSLIVLKCFVLYNGTIFLLIVFTISVRISILL